MAKAPGRLPRKNQVRSNRASLYNYRWSKTSKLFLQVNPFCVVCDRLATVTDHIKPHRGDVVLFWDDTNWQPMCGSCHAAKSAKEGQEENA